MQKISEILNSQTAPAETGAKASSRPTTSDAGNWIWSNDERLAGRPGVPEPVPCEFCGALRYHKGIPLGNRILWPPYPTEAVISFNPAYRSQNLSYWAEAGRMLGASDGESDYELLSGGSGTAVVYDLSGLSFSPQIKVEGDTDEDALIRKLRDLEPEFIDFILEALSRREGGAYVTADSRLY